MLNIKIKISPKLNLIVNNDTKPTNGIWTYFRTINKDMLIYHKSDKGYVDLTLNGKADKQEKIKSMLTSIVENYYEQGYEVVKTGKSCAIRVKVPVVTFSEPFEKQKDSIDYAFSAVEKLYALSIKLDLAGVYDL